MEGHGQRREEEDDAMRLRGGGSSIPSQEDSSEGKDQFEEGFSDRQFRSAAQGRNSSRFRSDINFDPSVYEGSTMSESMYSTDNPFTDAERPGLRDTKSDGHGVNYGNSGG